MLKNRSIQVKLVKDHPEGGDSEQVDLFEALKGQFKHKNGNWKLIFGLGVLTGATMTFIGFKVIPSRPTFVDPTHVVVRFVP